ncbi:MAG: TetR/AcrR family transcriptional regulator [Verrucomicrobia bacterium]|nr:TetR/AcrR family transcriptional regulator [Kiritimatiellia bacterium]MCP5487021.1 TetR/AcrR family transcriptional regulator [Verrucomicrobiota bacterium]
MSRIVKKPEERRREILNAAREMFRTLDYDHSTMNHLMDKLGVAKGTIYHYFRSKEDLLEAVVADMIEHDLAHKQALMEKREFKVMNAIDQFRTLLAANTLAQDNDGVLDALHRPGNTVLHAQQLGQYLNRLCPLFAQVIQKGVADGDFTCPCPLEAAELLLGGIQFLTDVGFFPWNEKDIARRQAAIPVLVESQLGAPKGSFSFLTPGADTP